MGREGSNEVEAEIHKKWQEVGQVRDEELGKKEMNC